MRLLCRVHIYLFSQQQLLQREILRRETRSAHHISQIIMLLGKGSFYLSLFEYKNIPLVLLFMESVKFYYANSIFCSFATHRRMRFSRRRNANLLFRLCMSCWLGKRRVHSVETVHADMYQSRGKGVGARENLEI